MMIAMTHDAKMGPETTGPHTCMAMQSLLSALLPNTFYTRAAAEPCTQQVTSDDGVGVIGLVHDMDRE